MLDVPYTCGLGKRGELQLQGLGLENPSPTTGSVALAVLLSACEPQCLIYKKRVIISTLKRFEGIIEIMYIKQHNTWLIEGNKKIYNMHEFLSIEFYRYYR